MRHLVRKPRRHTTCRIDRTRPLGQTYRVPDGGDWKRLGEFVASWRGRKSWSRAELATRMGMDTKTVDRIEQGKSVAKTTVGKLDVACGWAPGSAVNVLNGGGVAIIGEPDDALAEKLQALEEKSAEIQRKLGLVWDVFDDYGPDAARAATHRLTAEFAELQAQITEAARGENHPRHVG
jgi:transcriptional regulator with XRE-family HTH domain